jgi:hypothetical protein
MALRNGGELVKKLPGNALLLGEMGIGNPALHCCWRVCAASR